MDTPTTAERRTTLITYLLLTFLVVIPVYSMITPYLVSLASGAIFAVLCQPMYNRLRRYLAPRWAGLVVTLGVLILVLAPITLLVVGAIRQASTMVESFTQTETMDPNKFSMWVQESIPYISIFGSPEQLEIQVRDSLSTAAQALSGFILQRIGLLPNIMLELAIVVLSTYFFLIDGRRAIRWVAGKLPLSRQIRLTLLGSLRSATNSVVLASIAASATQAMVIFIGFLSLGVPAPFLAGGVGFVLAWMPIFGTVPLWGGATIYLYMQDSPGKAAIMFGIGIFVGIIDNVVRPLVLQGRQEMHPMVSLIAILGGLAMFGVPGAFLGPLFVTLAISILDIWPAVASYCGIPVNDSGEEVPEIPLLDSGKL